MPLMCAWLQVQARSTWTLRPGFSFFGRETWLENPVSHATNTNTNTFSVTTQNRNSNQPLAGFLNPRNKNPSRCRPLLPPRTAALRNRCPPRLAHASHACHQARAAVERRKATEGRSSGRMPAEVFVTCEGRTVLNDAHLRW